MTNCISDKFLKDSFIGGALLSHVERRTVAMRMVQPILTASERARYEKRGCEYCGRWGICCTTLGLDAEDGLGDDCWRPEGCLLVWEE